MSKLLKLRAAPAYLNLADPRIDRENLVIRDTVAMLANVEALGHGFQTDQRTLEMMLGLSRQYSRGIKMRFGHPGMSENAMGQHIAWAKNFRIQADKLLHDIHFMEQAAISPSFANDPIEYLFQMAEQHPEDIGESVVIECETVWTLPDGSEVDGYGERPENALTELPVIRPVKFYFVDVVGEPALTRDGLLASMFSGSSALYSEQAFSLIDEFRSEYGISLEELPRKVEQVTARYVHSRGLKPGVDMKKRAKFEESTGVEEGLVTDVLDETPAEDTSPDAEPAAEAQPTLGTETDEVDAALATAKETESALAGDQPEQPEGQEEEMSGNVPFEMYEAALARIDALEEQIAKVLELATVNARNNQSLAQRLVALEEEPVVTDRIGGPRTFDVPRLGTNGLKKPEHVTHRIKQQQKTPVAGDDPALMSLAASAARSSR